MQKKKLFTLLPLSVAIASFIGSADAATVVMTDSDFPTSTHTYVNGSGNVLHIQNTGTVDIVGSSPNTGQLASESGAVLIVDDHIRVTNTATNGDAILLVGAAKANFNNGFTATVAGNFYAVGIRDAGSELLVKGTTNIIAPDNIGYGILLEAGTKSSFDGVVNINSGKAAIFNRGQAEFKQQVNLNLHGNDSRAIYNNSSGTNFLNFSELLSINMAANSDSSSYNYGIYNNAGDMKLLGGLVANLNGDAFSYGRVGVYAAAGQVDIEKYLYIYTPKAGNAYALYANGGGKIVVDNALTDLNGNIVAAGAGSLIDITTQAGSVIRSDVNAGSGSTINFNLNKTTWYFEQNSRLSLLDATQSNIYFPTGSSGNFKTLTVDNITGNNSVFFLSTVLNNSGVQETDRIIVNQNSSGQHRLNITNVGDSGGLTAGDGIMVVEVNGTSTANNFKLNNVVRSGLYEYTLHQGSLAIPANQNWYLRSSEQQLNPDIGSYLANQTAATGLFMHGLHDRVGEPQYAERNKQQGSQPSVWLRTLRTHSENQAGGGIFNQNNNGSLIHMGGDLAQWTTDDKNRYHFGIMGAYGRSETTTRSISTDSRVKSKIDGYGAGAYFTWYSNESMPQGWYADVWSMYSWFDNESESINKYKSNAWTSSAEVGYALKLADMTRWQLMVEPQGQLAYTRYNSDDHTDSNGLTVTDDDANGITSRLGARVYLRDSLNKNSVQPFIEGNWLHSTAKNSLKFDGRTLSDDTPANRLETKVGIQGAITPQLQVYSHLGLQWGKNSYQGSEGQIGIKYRF